ncbi:hypothetical protein M2650_12300 [Luteimonas sp. SX5]|uniref:Uncharacterized protein n=1 Tax=Luteimonas galliterrae TaxID=2940486 RepID=A0ABT0MKI2_9GAMM|nr:hypothetical protein [Luteimonas galliterrae]MCL1635402.1 hypothetical protein [Luteimonas galliterrae]
MSKKYSISESVGAGWEPVENYESLEKHHPTWPEDPERRNYSQIDGSREEFVYSSSRDRLVSKDFVLSVDGNPSVDIPSPVSGFVKRSARLDRWGAVEIYDSQGDDAKILARVLHMNPIRVTDGEKIEYGQLLGQQSNKAPIKIGVHTHMDFNEWHLNQFREYLHDLDSGAITPKGYINEYLKFDASRRQMDEEPQADRWFRSANPQPRTDVHDGRPDPRERNHPDYALYEAIRKALPDKYSDDMAAHVMLQAKIGGVLRANDIDKIIVRDDRIFVMGTTPGFRTDVYLSQAAPPMQETVQRSEDFDKQQAQQHQQWLAQEQQLSQERGMRYSL